MDAYFRMPWLTVFMPGSIVASRKKYRGKPTESLAAYERKSTGSNHLDLSN